MGNVRLSRLSRTNWLADGPLALHLDAFKQYLTDRGYAATTFANCVGSITHFAQWVHGRRLRVQRIDEADLAMKEKALARLEAPDTRMRRFLAPDSLMRFLQTL